MDSALRRKLDHERDLYYRGYRAGGQAVLAHLRENFDLDDPEHGGPVESAQDSLNNVLEMLGAPPPSRRPEQARGHDG